MVVVTINILVRHLPLNEEQVLGGKLVLLLPDEQVEFAEEKRAARKSKFKLKTRVITFLYLIGHYVCFVVLMTVPLLS